MRSSCRWGALFDVSPMTPDTVSLGPLRVVTVDGAEVSMSSAWADSPAVLIWLRHFG